MNTNTTIATTIAALLGLGVLWQTLQKSDMQAELDTLKAAHEKLIREDQEQFGRLNKSIATLERQLSDAQSRSNLAKAEALGTEPPAAHPAAPAAARGGALQNLIMQRMNSPEVQNTMLQMAYNNRYGAFISSLKLPPDKEAALKQKIMDILGKRLALQQKANTGEVTREELAAYSVDKEVEAAMSDTLARDQLDAWRNYDAQRQARQAAQMQNNLSAQMANQAPGLTEQSRGIVAAALAKAITANAGNAAQNGPVGQAALAGQNVLSKAYEDTEYQLQGKLDEAQMKIARDYLRQQSKLINVLTQ